MQAIIKAGQGLPGYEKSTCARDVAELLSLHQLGGYISPSRKQAKRKEPRAPSATKPSDDWTNPCVLGSKCRKHHSPAKCAEFKKLTPEVRLSHILALGLCQLCYRYPDTRKCWSLGKVPGCNAPECGANHHNLLHGAISRGRAMMTRGANNVLLCCQMISVEIGGRSQQLQVLYDSGATLTLITHEAADRTGLQSIRQQLKSVSGLNRVVVSSSCFYMVPMVDCNDEVHVIKAFGVARIAWMDRGTLLPDMDVWFHQLKGEAINLQQDEGYVDLLIGADNSRWMPAYVGSSEFPFDSLRLMMSSFGEHFILMGSPGKQTGASPGVDAEGNWQSAIRDLGSITNTGAILRGVMRPVPPTQGLVGASAAVSVPQSPNRPAAPAPTPRGPSGNAPPAANSRRFWRTPPRAPRAPVSSNTPVTPPVNLHSRARPHHTSPLNYLQGNTMARNRPRLGQADGMSIQRVMTLLALMLTGAPGIYGFQAYDCNNASAPLEQYSLLEPEPCPDMLKQHELERNLEGEIVQLKKERLIHTTRCQVYETIQTQYCGFQSRAGATRYLKMREALNVEPADCRLAEKTGKIKINGKEQKVQIGVSMSFHIYLRGGVDMNNNCEVGTFEYGGKEYTKQVVLASYEVLLRQEWARASDISGMITMASGIIARTTNRSIMGSAEGTYVWSHSEESCPDTGHRRRERQEPGGRSQVDGDFPVVWASSPEDPHTEHSGVFSPHVTDPSGIGQV